MKEIRTLLKSEHIFTNAELRDLSYLFRIIYGISEDVDLEVNKGIKRMMAYDLKRSVICINWDEIKKVIDRNKILPTNYLLAFALIHELNHALQKRRVDTIKDYISYVYSICFSYIDIPSISIVSELKRAIYNESHDLFPIEINADVMSHLKMLEILEGFDEGYYDIYKYFLINRLMKLYNTQEFKGFYEHVLGLKCSDVSYSVEECLLYGLPIKEAQISERDIIRLIK